MKKHYVYEIVNHIGTVEYIGETINPKIRLQRHKGNKNNKFYKRKDIVLNVVKEFDNKSDAYEYQCKLQNQYGFINDRDKCIGYGTQPKKVIAIDKNTGKYFEFDSISKCAKAINAFQNNISQAIKTKKSVRGYTFKLK